MVLLHPPLPTRRRPRVQRPAAPVAPLPVPVPRTERPAARPRGLRERGWTQLSRGLDRVPAGFWRVTALYLAGRYLVLLAAAAVVVLDPRGAAAELARWRGVGEVALLLGGRAEVGTALLGGLLGWVLVLLVRAHLLRTGAAPLAGRAPLLLALSALTAVVCTTLPALLVPAGVLAAALLVRRRAAVR